MPGEEGFSVETLKALKAIAEDSFKRAHLIQDKACIGGLVLVLSNPSPAVVALSLETLLLLADTRERRQVLRQATGLVQSLEAMIVARSKLERAVQQQAEQLYDVLTEDQATPLWDTSNTSSSAGEHQRSRQERSKMFLTTAPSRTRLVVLQIRGMTDRHDRDVCRDLLVRVRGVVSITFDAARHRALCRTKKDLKPESLASAVARSQTMTAELVLKDEHGNETLMPLLAAGRERRDKENVTGLPAYLPADASPGADGKPLARRGEAGKDQGGWFKSVTNFVSTSFYW